MDDLKIKTRKVANTLVIEFTGNFDYDMDNVTEEFVENLMDTQSRTIVLDLHKIKKVASAFVNRLVKILRLVENEKGKLYLLNVPAAVLKILSMVNIVGRFRLFTTESELKSALGGSAAEGPADADRKAPTLAISKTRQGPAHTFALKGAFVEGAGTGDLLDEVKASTTQSAQTITLDFKEVHIIDSVSVGILLMIQKMCEEKKIAISIANPNDLVRHVLSTHEVGPLFGL